VIASKGVLLLKDLVFKDILLELGKGALEDYVKDFFKDCIKGGIDSTKPRVLKKAFSSLCSLCLRGLLL